MSIQLTDPRGRKWTLTRLIGAATTFDEMRAFLGHCREGDSHLPLAAVGGVWDLRALEPVDQPKPTVVGRIVEVSAAALSALLAIEGEKHGEPVLTDGEGRYFPTPIPVEYRPIPISPEQA